MKTGKNILRFLLALLEPVASAIAWACIKAKADRENSRHLKAWNAAR